MPPLKSFDIVTSFEVLEHTPTPLDTVKSALVRLKEGGIMIFSTMLIDSLAPRDMQNWYIAPRNGHISLYSSKAMKALFATFGYEIHHFNEWQHIATKMTS